MSVTKILRIFTKTSRITLDLSLPNSWLLDSVGVKENVLGHRHRLGHAGLDQIPISEVQDIGELSFQCRTVKWLSEQIEQDKTRWKGWEENGKKKRVTAGLPKILIHFPKNMTWFLENVTWFPKNVTQFPKGSHYRVLCNTNNQRQ